MPIYEYKCEECDETFNKVSKIADRKVPVNSPCPSCGELKVKQIITQTAVGDPFALGRVKLDGGMKNVMEKVRSVAGAEHCRSRFEDL